MASRDFKRELIDMIDRLLAGAWTVEEFRREYYDCWLDGVPRGVLSDDEEEFFLMYRSNSIGPRFRLRRTRSSTAGGRTKSLSTGSSAVESALGADSARREVLQWGASRL